MSEQDSALRCVALRSIPCCSLLFRSVTFHSVPFRFVSSCLVSFVSFRADSAAMTEIKVEEEEAKEIETMSEEILGLPGRRLEVLSSESDPLKYVVAGKVLRIGLPVEVWPTQTQCKLALAFDRMSSVSCSVRDVEIDTTEMKCFLMNTEYLLGASNPANTTSTTTVSSNTTVRSTTTSTTTGCELLIRPDGSVACRYVAATVTSTSTIPNFIVLGGTWHPSTTTTKTTTTSRLIVAFLSTSAGSLHDIVLGTMHVAFESLRSFVVNSTMQMVFSNGIAAAIPNIHASDVTLLAVSKGRRLLELVEEVSVDYEIVVAATPGGAFAEEVASRIFNSPDMLKSHINSAFKDASLNLTVDSVTSPRPLVKVLQSTLQTTSTSLLKRSERMARSDPTAGHMA